MEKREPIMPSNHFIKTFFESFAEDPIFNSVDKEKEGDVDETENQTGKNATNKYVPENNLKYACDSCWEKVCYLW